MRSDDEIRLEFEKEKERNALVMREMYNILMDLRNGQDIGTVLSRLGKDDLFDEALERCVQSGYVEGIYPTRVASGGLVVDYGSNAGITREGERFTVFYKPNLPH